MPRCAARARKARKIFNESTGAGAESGLRVKSTAITVEETKDSGMQKRLAARKQVEKYGVIYDAVYDAVKSVGDLAGQSATMIILGSERFPEAKERAESYRRVVHIYLEAHKDKLKLLSSDTKSKDLPSYFGLKPTIVTTQIDQTELLFWIEAEVEISLSLDKLSQVRLRILGPQDVAERVRKRILKLAAARLRSQGIHSVKEAPVERLEVTTMDGLFPSCVNGFFTPPSSSSTDPSSAPASSIAESATAGAGAGSKDSEVVKNPDVITTSIPIESAPIASAHKQNS